MPDPATPVAAPVATPAAATVVPDAVKTPDSYIGPAGELKEGWIDHLVPEDVRGQGVFKKFTDVSGMLKQMAVLDQYTGRQGKGLMVPPEDATQTERDAFYSALGRPAVASEYKIAPPTGMEEAFKSPAMTERLQVMFDAGMTQKQVEAVIAHDVKNLASAKTASEAALAAAKEEAVAELHKRWGAAYEERLHIANRMIEENVTDADKPKLLEAIGNNPYVSDFLANIGKKFMEGKAVNPDSASGAMTPGEARLKLDELTAVMVREPNMRQDNPAKYQRMTAESRNLATLALAGS